VTTPAEAAAAAEAYFVQLNADRQQYRDWIGGTPTGGPGGDGKYPLTDFTGNTYLIPCPAKAIADLPAGGTGFNLAGINALPIAVTADGTGTGPKLLGTTTDGLAAKRFNLFDFTQTKIADRTVLQGGEFAEWIDCLSSTGNERKLAVNSLVRSFGGIIDPTLPPYNVVYDAQKTKPVSLTNGSNIVVTGNAVFTSADIGKIINVSNGSAAGPLVGYIGEVTDSKHIKIFTDLTFTTPSNAGSTRGGEEMVWGTDCTVGMQAALDAADPPDQISLGKVVVVGGFTLVRSLRFGSISIVGLSQTGCGFVRLATTATITTWVAAKSTGGPGNIYATWRPSKYTIKDLTFYGQRYTQYYNPQADSFGFGAAGFFQFYLGAPYGRLENLDFWEGHVNNIHIRSSPFAGTMNNIRSYFAGQCGIRIGFWDLNGINWHCEGNQGAGVVSYMPGANISTVRSSFNGAGGGGISNGGLFWPHHLGCNWCECGVGNTITNLRMQESWSDNLVIAKTDPLSNTTSGGSNNQFYLGTFDDTSDIAPGGGSKTRMPGMRAMLFMSGNTVVRNEVNLVAGGPHVKSTNYATNGYWDEGDTFGNNINLKTNAGVTNVASTWYAGNATTDALATARGPWGHASSSSIGTRNSVTVNGALAP
jgi:hypothetical protein